MTITQVGPAAASDELTNEIVGVVRNDALVITDLRDIPDYAAETDRYLYTADGTTLTWASLPTAGINWEVQTTDVTAADKIGYLASNGITITLRSNPAVGDLVAVADANSEFNTRPVTINGNGNNIEQDPQLVLDLRNAFVQFVFNGTTWDIVQSSTPFNIQEITEESFPPGSITYTMSRIPPSSSSVLVTINGAVQPTTSYAVTGNTLTFGTAPTSTVFLRYVGIASSINVSDTPIGAMMYFPNNSPIDGWLDCTGGTIGSSIYPDLVRYLSKNPNATTATLPDSRGNFIRTWDHGSGRDDLGSTTAIPTDLSDNSWGTWLDTLDSGTAENAFDGSTGTRTSVNFASGYVGYAFDVPVTLTAANIFSSDTISTVHLPTSIRLRWSDDGVTWNDASLPNLNTLQNTDIALSSTETNPHRYWAIFGTGGTAYASDPSRYWGVAYVTFTGTTTGRLVGGNQNESVGTLNLTLEGNSAGSTANGGTTGTDLRTIVAGSTGLVTGGGSETRPANQTYILRIKAFHYQSGELSSTEITSLRNEISRLATLVTDALPRSGANVNLSSSIDVFNLDSLTLTNSASTNISTISGGRAGQTLHIIFADGNTTLVSNNNIRLAGGNNVTGTALDGLILHYNGTSWIQMAPISNNA